MIADFTGFKIVAWVHVTEHQWQSNLDQRPQAAFPERNICGESI